MTISANRGKVTIIRKTKIQNKEMKKLLTWWEYKLVIPKCLIEDFVSSESSIGISTRLACLPLICSTCSICNKWKFSYFYSVMVPHPKRTESALCLMRDKKLQKNLGYKPVYGIQYPFSNVPPLPQAVTDNSPAKLTWFSDW